MPLQDIIDGVRNTEVSALSVEGVFFQLLEQPAVILMLALLIEILLPIPNSSRLYNLTPIFNLMAKKVNRPENTAAHTYFAGILLPCLIIGVTLVLMVLFETVAGTDVLVGLIVLPWVLESRVMANLAVRVCSLLKEEEKDEARHELSQHVIREVDKLSAMGIAKGTTECVAQGLFTTWFAVLVWYMLAGMTGAIIMQLCNVLARAFSAKYPRNREFGKPIARIQHGMLIPAALVLAFCELFSFHPIANLKSGFAGIAKYPAGVLGFSLGVCASACRCSLGGPRYYAGTLVRYVKLGPKKDPGITSPLKALRHLRWAGIVFVCVCVCFEALFIL